MKKIGFVWVFLIGYFCFSSSAQEGYMFRLILKDKGNPAFSIERPHEFLSGNSLERRLRQGIPVDSTDLPIDPAYINQITASDASVVALSKWLKTVTVHCPDSSAVNRLLSLPFIDTAYVVWKGEMPYPEMPVRQKNEPVSSAADQSGDFNIYGQAYAQISLLNGDYLHDAGFYGEGMKIAVLDGGFMNCDRIDAFDQSRIMEVKDFTHQKADPFRINQKHGTAVLSCMLSYKPGIMVGTAPKADYYLFMTEVSDQEFPVEEDYWIAAVEYADSIGIDIINTSLGYTTFDRSDMDHLHSQLDGQTVFSSIAANMAAEKGLLLLNAAGNEGNKEWKKISFPADAEYVITVGSVDKNKVLSDFSSVGPTADGRIKPDLVALGSEVAVMNEYGSVSVSWGTSFSTPILAGVVACLWQALPGRTNMDMIGLMKKQGDRYAHPDTAYGFGIPDVLNVLEDITHSALTKGRGNELSLYATHDRLYINLDPAKISTCRLSIYNGLGQRVMYLSHPSESIETAHLPKGVYITYIECSGGMQLIGKFIK